MRESARSIRADACCGDPIPTQSGRFELCLDACGQPLVRAKLTQEPVMPVDPRCIHAGAKLLVEAVAVNSPDRKGDVFVQIDGACASLNARVHVPVAAVRSVEPEPVRIGDRFYFSDMIFEVKDVVSELDRGLLDAGAARGVLLVDDVRVGSLSLKFSELARMARA